MAKQGTARTTIPDARFSKVDPSKVWMLVYCSRLLSFEMVDKKDERIAIVTLSYFDLFQIVSSFSFVKWWNFRPAACYRPWSLGPSQI